MSKLKAVVLEKSGTSYTVLDREGTFRQVKRRINAEVGDEIELNVARDGFRGLRVWVGVAALFLMTLTSLLGWNLYQAPTAVALVSVDINPSLQFTVDTQGRFLELQNQNEDARQMLAQIALKGKPIDEVLEKIVTLAYNQNFINPEHDWIVVGYSPMTDKSIEKMPKELNKLQISNWVTEPIAKEGLTPEVAVFTLTPQERDLAQKGDLSLGEFGLWQAAQKAGVITESGKLKDTMERVRLLENPQVKALIKADKKEIDPNLPLTPGTSMEKSRALDNPIEKGPEKQKPKESPSAIKPPNFRSEKDKEPVASQKQPTETKAESDHEKMNNQENGQVDDKIDDQVNGRLNEKIDDQVNGHLDEKVDDNLDSQVKDKTKNDNERSKKTK